MGRGAGKCSAASPWALWIESVAVVLCPVTGPKDKLAGVELQAVQGRARGIARRTRGP